LKTWWRIITANIFKTLRDVFQCPDAEDIDSGIDEKPSSAKALSKNKAVQKFSLTVGELVEEACRASWGRGGLNRPADLTKILDEETAEQVLTEENTWE